MTKLQKNNLCLDLENDQDARNAAFMYATAIMIKKPTDSLLLMQTIRNLEIPQMEGENGEGH